MGKKEVGGVEGRQFGYFYHNSFSTATLYYYYYFGIVSQHNPSRELADQRILIYGVKCYVRTCQPYESARVQLQ